MGIVVPVQQQLISFLGNGTRQESEHATMQQPKTTNTRRIRQVSVTNLFGIFNHVIPLKMDEHITIIHEPNGFGKTVMFKLLHALFSPVDQLIPGYLRIQNIPFEEFRVEFEDNTSFWVSKTSQSDEPPGEQEIVFHATGKKPYTIPSLSLLVKSISLSGSIDHITADIWRNVYTGEILSWEDVAELFVYRSPEDIRVKIGIPEWLIDMAKSVPIRLIETERLSFELIKYNNPDRIRQEAYADDTEQKLGIFDELAQKRDLLTTIINDRFLYKIMTLSKEEGFVFTTENGTSLPLENLSSGEQHELVLFYDLLFRVTRGSLILIDEPELALHVVW
jgi:AAA domain, putative AbiEii toxin, Type IV TA system